MSFYRGVGGSGDANDDASISQVTTAQVAAAASQAAAATSASNAATSASNAATSASNAATSASNAATSATAADLSKDDAAVSALAASTSETNASASETAAAASEAAALASETAALASETAASASETAAAASEATATAAASSASTSATSATASAASASTSASAASGSAAAALASQVAAAASETAAAASETAAAASEATATAAATTATTAATNASTSASAASSSQTAAAASEAAAATSSSNAATSASNAATSASNAATSASNASSSATSAAVSASSASSAADAALAALDNFDDRYLGQKASDPTLDNDGNALLTGALYFNTVDGIMKVYDGSTWLAAYASLSGALLTTNNLSDVADAPTARTNLGLGTAATTASTDYATAAQGALADTAVQPAAIANMLESTDIGVTVQGYNANTVVDASYVHTDNNYTTTEKNKLAGIASGAEVNVNADWNAVSGDAQILNKPTAVSSFTNDSGYITSSDSITGNAATATTASATSATLTRGTYLTGSNFNGSAATTWAVDATSANTASKVVARDASGNFSAGTISATTFSGSGASLTTLNASNLSSGTVPDARISGSYTGMTNLTGSGTVDFAKFLGNAADTAAAPSFSWTGDTNTGIYSPGADQIGIATGGVSRFTVSTTAINSTLPLSATAITATSSVLPATDNTGVVGSAALTWNNGQFTNLTVDGTLSVRAAIDLADSDIVQFGSSDDTKFFYDGTNNTMEMELEASANSFIITDNGTTRFTFGRSAGSLTLNSGPLVEFKSAIGASAIDLNAGNYFTKTISGATTFTISNIAASGNVSAFVLELTNGGAAAVTWFSGVTWAAGTPPTLTAAGVDTLAFFTHNGGTTWRGFVLGQGMA